MEHELSAFYDITHGHGLAILTPRWMRHILSERTMDRFVKYGINVFGIDPTLPKQEIAGKAIDATYEFFESINIPMHLREVGIDDSRLAEMAESADAADLKSAIRENVRVQVPFSAPFRKPGAHRAFFLSIVDRRSI